MASVRSIMKDWLPSLASVAAVLLTATYAVTRQSRAAEGIQDANQLAATLTNTATLAAETTRSPQEIQELADRRADLERRMQDALKPGTVVSALAELAGKAALTVHEIQPKADSIGQRSDLTSPAYPAYRILVQGSYAAIADYVERCKEGTIPARVRELHVFRDRTTGEHTEDGLMAEIVVETFIPANAQKQGAD